MFKQLAIILGLGFFTTSATAQQATQGNIKYEKADEPALLIEYDYPGNIVENALVAKFADKQISGTVSKDFRVYPNAIVEEISKSRLDYIFKIENTASNKSTLYMIMQGSGNIEGVDQLGNRGKAFLENMAADVRRSNDVAELKKQEAIMVKEEENMAELEKVQKDLEEKLAAHQAKLAAQQKIIASQKAILDDIKARLN